MTLSIIAPGIQSTIQGAPFKGQRHLGIPACGAADPLSLAIANRLVGNAFDVAGIEIALGNFAVRAEQDISLAITGAACTVAVASEAVETDTALQLRTGEALRIGPVTAGCRVYLAAAGGFDLPFVMGSQSTCLGAGFGGLEGRALHAGDRLQCRPAAVDRNLQTVAQRPVFGRTHIMRFVAGPEWEWTTADSQRKLAGETFTIGRRASRMGLQLEGTKIATGDANLASAAVFPGTIQRPPDGKPFLLGVDAQTTGGYPRTAQVIRADRHLIGQMQSGDRLRLVRVEAEQAQQIYREKLALWRQFIPDLRLR